MPTLQVFEHQTLRVGEQGFTQTEFLAFAERPELKFYIVLHRAVRFGQYVGVLKIGDLTVEILPKADASAQADTHRWRDVLIAMLRYCRFLKLETLSSADLRLRKHSILDLYLELFLQEVEHLLQKGLIKKYRRVAGQTIALKGQLQFAKQLQHNLTHQERFYTKHETYDLDHLLHQILWQALSITENMATTPTLSTRAQQLKARFPKVTATTISQRHFDRLPKNRQTQRYQDALDIARLLILNFQPDVKSGQHSLLALLFDMNLLFEEYVFQRLRRAGLWVQRQQARPFWNRSTIRPDIILRLDNQTIVLDTKWKVLRQVSPAMQDVQQAFVYAQYFEAEKTVLLYPEVHELGDLPPLPYQLPGRPDNYFCQVHFAKILSPQGLNPDFVRDLLAVL